MGILAIAAGVAGFFLLGAILAVLATRRPADEAGYGSPFDTVAPGAYGAEDAGLSFPLLFLGIVAALVTGFATVYGLMNLNGGGTSPDPLTAAAPPSPKATLSPAPATPPTRTPVSNPTSTPTHPPTAVPPTRTRPAATRAPTLTPTPRDSGDSRIDPQQTSLSGDWLLVDSVTRGPGAGESYSFRVHFSERGALVTGAGDGLAIQGMRIGNVISATFQRGSSTGAFKWSIAENGQLVGTFVDAGAGNSGQSNARLISDTD
jgi:hypothetical protein